MGLRGDSSCAATTKGLANESGGEAKPLNIE